jgi:hypothetical protein
LIYWELGMRGTIHCAIVIFEANEFQTYDYISGLTLKCHHSLQCFNFEVEG